MAGKLQKDGLFPSVTNKIQVEAQPVDHVNSSVLSYVESLKVLI